MFVGLDVKMDGDMDGPKAGFAGRLEVIERRTGRRRWSDAEKARIASESLRPGARVADVARRHGTTRWQIYDWRKRLTRGMLTVSADGTLPFASVVVSAERAPSTLVPAESEVRTNIVEVVVDRLMPMCSGTNRPRPESSSSRTSASRVRPVARGLPKTT